MVKIVNTLITIICLFVLFASGISCAPNASPPALEKQVAIVQRGNLAITVSVDGNLVMPQAYNLLFGAPGDVQDVFVEEGDFVKEGTVLATLDNTNEKLAVESANNSVQQVLSRLYESVPLQPQFPIYGPDTGSILGYPYYYPNATALSACNWAQDEVSNAYRLYQNDDYTAAASELYIALSDLEACIAIFDDTINNPESGLGNIAPFIDPDEPSSFYLYNTFATIYIRELRQLIGSIKQTQADMERIRELIAQEEYAEAAPLFQSLLTQVDDIGKGVISNINVIKTYNFGTVYGEDLCLYFYDAAADKLNAALRGIESGGLNAPGLHDNLRIADHYMLICNGILSSNENVLQHGLLLKNEQQYNVDLQTALVGLGNARDDFLKTVVLAPFDGTVVSIGVKKDDVLSAIDYASKTAVQLVDTSQVKFTGLVDEIDILKIEAGQKATISVDAVPDKTFTGTVSFISPYGSTDTGNVVKFAVTIKLDPTDEELKGGLTATADIAVYDVQDVLLVPLSAVTTTPAGSFVTVINGATGQTEERKVVLGNQNFQYAEVLSGVEEGESVIIEEKVVGAPVVTPIPQGPPGDR